MEIIAFLDAVFRDNNLIAHLCRMWQNGLWRGLKRTIRAYPMVHEIPTREILQDRGICGVRHIEAPHAHVEIIRNRSNVCKATHGIFDTSDALRHDIMRSVCYIDHPEGVCPCSIGIPDKNHAVAKIPFLVLW